MTTKLSYNARPGIDWQKLLEQVKAQGGVATLVFECYPSELHRLVAFLPYVTLPIWRPVPPDTSWSSENLHEKTVAPEWIDQRIAELTAATFKPGQVAIHLHNEAGWSEKMLAWELRAAQHARNRGWATVCVNASVGTPPQDQLHMAKDLLAYAAQWPDLVYLGLHEYMSVTGDRKSPWYIRRWSFWENYRKSVGIGDVRYVITEFGAEDISDDHEFTSNLPKSTKPDGKKYGHIGGVHTLEAAWRMIYGAHFKSVADQYMREIVKAFDAGLYADKRIVGVCLFSWGAGGRWADYDVSAMTDLHALINEWAKQAPPLEPEPETGPVEPVRAIAIDGDIRIRTAPVNGDIVGKVSDGEIVTVLEGSGQIGMEGRWLKIQDSAGVVGYSAAWLYKPSPVDEPPDDPPAPEYVTMTRYRADLATRDREIADLMEKVNMIEVNVMEFLKLWAAVVREDVTRQVVSELITRLSAGHVEVVKTEDEPETKEDKIA